MERPDLPPKVRAGLAEEPEAETVSTASSESFFGQEFDQQMQGVVQRARASLLAMQAVRAGSDATSGPALLGVVSIARASLPARPATSNTTTGAAE